MSQTNRNQDTRKALEARVAALEAELAACQQARSQSPGSTPPTPPRSSTSEPLAVSASRVTGQPDALAWQPVVASLVQHTLLPTAVFDTEVRYVAASDGWLEAYGLQDRDIVGISHYELFPEIGEDWQAIHARCLAGAHEARTEDAFLRADGGMDWITWSVYPWYDSHGDIAGIVMSTAIVTEQVLARENERIFRRLVESASDGVIMSDLDDTIRYANPAYKVMLELDPDVELSGQSLKAYASSDLADLNATMRREGHWRGVIEQRRPSGDTFPAEVTAFAMRDKMGNLTRRAAIYRDISNERRMLTELTHSSQQLQVIMQSLPVVLFVTDTEGIITLSEGQALPLLGLHPGEVVGRSIFEYYAAKQDVIDNVRRALEGHATTFDMYFEDHDLYFQRHFAPLYAEDGQVTGMLGIGYDVTARRQAAVDLDAWKRRYDLIVASSGQVVYEYDIATGDITWSGSVKHVLGFDVADIAGGIDRWMALIHPADADRTVQALEHAQAATSAYNIEYRFANAKGNYVPMVDRGFFITDENGEAVTMLGMMQDISDRKRAQKDLQLFRTLVASSTDAIMLTNADGSIAYANDAYGDLLGWHQADFDGDLLGELAEVSLSDNGKATLVEAVGEILTTGRWEGFIEHQHKQGKLIPTLMTSFAINDPETGELQYVANIIKDVTVQQDAQDRLVESERRLQILVANLPVILFGADKDGIVTLSDGQALKDIGLRAGEIVGLSIFDYYQDMPVIIEHAARALAGEATTFEVHYAKTNQYFERYFAPLNDKDGNVTGMLGIGYNITERKRASEALNAERERFFGLYQAVPDTIIRMHRDGTFLDYKPASYFASYVEPSDTIGKNLRENVAPDVVDRALISLEAAISTGEMQQFENTLEVNNETRYRENRFIKLNDQEAIAIVRDVTDLRRAEREIAASQQRLQLILANLPVVVFTIDKNGIFTMSEGKGLAELGLQPGQVVGMSVFDLYAELEEATTNLKGALAGDTRTHESQVADQVFDNHYTPLYDDTGEVAGVLGVAYNVTERKRDQRALRANAQRLRTVVANLPVIVFTLDQDGVFTLSEGKGLETLGLQPGQVVGMSFFELYANETDVIANMRQALAGEGVRFEDYVEETDSYFEQYYTPLYGSSDEHSDESSAEVTGVLGVVYDTSDIMRAQRNLEKAEKIAKLGNFTFDVAAGTAAASRQLFEIYRLPLADTIDLSAIEPYVPATEFAQVQQSFVETLTQGTVQVVEYSMNFEDGETRYFYSVWEPIFDEVNNVVQVFGTVQDISDRKQAEMALRESQRLLEDAQRIGRIGAWTFDIVKQELTWSKQVYEQFGVDPSTELTLEFAVSFYVDLDPLQAAMGRAIEHAEPYELELEISTTSGERRWIVSIGNPIVENDQVVRLTGIQQDITERKQAENALRESQQQLERAQRVANFGNFAIGVSDMSISASVQALAMHELPQDALLSLNDLVPLMSETDFEKVQSTIQQSVVEAREASVEYTLRLPSGVHREIHAIWQTSQNDHGEVYQIFGTVQDITRQKRAESALLENQRLLEDAQRIGAMGSWSLEVATGDITWSKQTYALLDIAEDQPLTLELVMSSYVDPDILQTAFDRAIGQAEPYDIEAEVITGGGKHRWVRVMGNPVVEADQVVRLTGVIQDISDIKQAEAELQTANSHLARINHIGSRLQGETSLQGMLEAVLEPLDAPANAMIFYAHNDSDDPHTMTAIELAACYHDTMIPLRTTFQLADYPWTQMYLDNPHETFIVTNVYQDARINELAHPVFTEFDFTTLIIVPLMQAGTWTGIFQMGWSQERHLSAGEQAYFNALPTLLAPAITNRRLLDNLEQTIKERTRALQVQLTETARFKSIVEATADLVSYGDLDGNILYLNPAGKRMLGYDEHDSNHQRYLPNVSDVYDDAGNERFALEVMPAVLETGLWRGETQVIGADGAMVPVSQVVNVIPDEQGQVVGVGTVVRDISDSKALEADLRQSNAVLSRLSQLSQAVNRATSKQALLEQISEIVFAEGAAGIVLYDVDNQTMTNQRPEVMVIAASLQPSGDSDPAFPADSRIRLADFQATRLFTEDTNNNLYVTDVTTDARFDEASKQLFMAIGSSSQVTVPLLQGNRWIGMIGFYWHDVHDYREDEKQLYDALRSLVPPVLSNLNIVADLENLVEARSSELRASNERLALLSQASTKLNEAESLDDMLRVISEVLVTRENFAVTVSYPVRNDAGEAIGVELRAVQQRGASQLPITIGMVSYFSDHPIVAEYAFSPEQVTFIDDVATDERFDAAARAFLLDVGVASQAFVALCQGEDVIGLVGINAAVGQPFSEHERQFIGALPSLLAPVVANLQLLESLEQTITERTAELQDQLTETTRFKTLIETTTDLVGYADLEGNIQYLNPAGYALIEGDDNGDNQAENDTRNIRDLYQHVSQLYTEASNYRFSEVAAPAINAHGSWRGEMTLQRTDGTHVPVSQVIATIPDHLGQPVALGTVIRDITESKALEHNLKTSNVILTRLSELSQAFNKVTSKQALLEVAAALAFDEGATAATLFDLDGQDHTGGTPETMTIAARSRADGRTDDIPLGLTFTLAEFASAALWLDYPDQLLCVENIFEDDRIDEETRRVLVETANTQAYVVVPLLQNNRWVGTFNFTWNEPHTCLERELQLYEALMTQVPPVLANLNIVSDLEDLVAARSAELQASNEQLALINRVSNELKAANSSDMMLEVLLEPLDRTASASLFYALNDDQSQIDAIQLVARRSPFTEPPLGTVLRARDFPSAQYILDNPDRPFMVSDVARDSRLDEAARAVNLQFGVAAYVMVPLRQSREWVGFLLISYPEVMTFTNNEEAYFRALPAIFAPPLANRRMVETLEDTVAKRSEELSRSRQLLRATVDNASSVIFVKDIQGRYILANRALAEFLGVQPTDIIGKTDFDLLPADVAQEVVTNDKSVIDAARAITVEEIVPAPEGERTFMATKYPLVDADGEIFALGCITTDITEQKKIDAEMQAYRDQIAKAETELQITQRIQELLLPASEELQAIEDLDIASYMQPAEQVGGDYYDILHIGDRVKIGIGDVTGHGLESGLLMLMTQTAVRTLLSSDEHDSKRVMDILNRTVFANLQRMQVDKSLTLSLLDYNQGKLSLSGQHEHVLIMRRDGSVETIDTIDLGMPLGLEEDITRFIAEHVVHLQPGEGAVLFTDGITEAENAQRVQFGLPRLVDLVGKHWQKPSEDIVYEIINAVYDHIAAHEVYDDITLIVFKRPSVMDGVKQHDVSKVNALR